MALGYVLTLMAGLGRGRAVVWLALTARLLLFVVVVAALSRNYGTVAGLAVLMAAVVTRGLLVRKRLVPFQLPEPEK